LEAGDQIPTFAAISRSSARLAGLGSEGRAIVVDFPLFAAMQYGACQCQETAWAAETSVAQARPTKVLLYRRGATT
jgi:hypothetical protein